MHFQGRWIDTRTQFVGPFPVRFRAVPRRPADIASSPTDLAFSRREGFRIWTVGT